MVCIFVTIGWIFASIGIGFACHEKGLNAGMKIMERINRHAH